MDASNTDTRPVVLVTNPGELTSTHVIHQLIEGGDYMVRGVVPDLKDKASVRPIRNLTKEPEPEPEPETETPASKADDKKEATPEKAAENVETADEKKDKEETAEDVKEEVKEEKEAEDNKESENKESEAAEGQEEKKDEEKDAKTEEPAKEEPAKEEPAEEEEEEEIDETKLQLVEADFTKSETLEAAVSGCAYVIHNASLLFKSDAVAPTEEEVKAAVDGTVALLKACQVNKVKRVVITSHLSAITGTALTVNDAEKTFNEEDWADVEKADPITKARVQVERAAWDFVKELTEEEKFDLVVVNPPSVLGPVLMGNKSILDSDLVKRFLERGMQVVSKLYVPVADVRDVAAANISALTAESAAGQRHIVMSQGMWLRDIAMILSKEFKPQGYSIPTMHCPAFGVKLLSFVNKNHKNQLPNIGKSFKIDSSKLKDILGVESHEVKATLLDMGHSLVHSGVVKKTKKYKGPRPEGEEEEAKPEAEDVAKGAANGTVASEGEAAEDKPAEEKVEEKTEEKAEEKAEEKSEDKPAETVEEPTPEAAAPAEETPAPTEAAETSEDKTESTPEVTDSKPDEESKTTTE